MKMSTGSIVGIIGGILTILGVVLPWMSDSVGNSISGLTAEISIIGMILLLFGILGLIMVVPGKRGLAIGSVVFGVLAMLVYLGMLGISSILTSALNTVGGTVSTGIGLYIGIVGSILLIAGAVMVMVSAKKAKMAPMAPPVAPPQAP